MVLFDYLKENYNNNQIIGFANGYLMESGSDDVYYLYDDLGIFYGGDAIKLLEDLYEVKYEDYFQYNGRGLIEFKDEYEVIEELEKYYENDLENAIFYKDKYIDYCLSELGMSDIDDLIHDINEFRFENMSKDELYKMLGLEVEDNYSKNQLYEMFMNYVEDDYEQ